MPLSGGSQLDGAAIRMLVRRQVRFGPSMSHRNAGEKGSAGSLCEQAEQHLRTEGFITVTLWVLKDNKRAVKFYQSNGFALDIGATKEIERGGKTLSEVRFRKPLIA